jgi:hypothetical protein
MWLLLILQILQILQILILIMAIFYTNQAICIPQCDADG